MSGNGNGSAREEALQHFPEEESPRALLHWEPESGSGAGHTVLELEGGPDFVMTEPIQDLCARALRYLSAGHAVHLSGPAGTGKTTLALHLAARLGRPVVLMHGDDEHRTSDLVGSENGFDRSRVVDNYIRTVLRTDETMRKQWVDNRLTLACKYGYTLVYDEFTRSRPEANNVLLSVLGERLLDVSRVPAGETYIPVHPQFSAIFTSNPEEYVGVHASQDALLDRMVTLAFGGYSGQTEAAIVAARTGVGPDSARSIMSVTQALRDAGLLRNRSTLRGAIVLGRIVARTGCRPDADDPIFVQTCLDVFGGLTVKGGPTPEGLRDAVVAACRASCGPASGLEPGTPAPGTTTSRPGSNPRGGRA